MPFCIGQSLVETYGRYASALSRPDQGKRVFITGASSGLGAALAVEYARAGASVAIAARRLDRLKCLAQQINSQGGNVLPLRCDIRIQSSVAEAIDTAARADLLPKN